MRILAIEPYYGGSHKAVLDGLIETVEAEWTLLSMPARKWKWRMRGGAITMAEAANRALDELRQAQGSDACFDLIFCSTFLNLAEFKGLVDPALASCPSVVYFHENQLSYPVRHEAEWDMHFALTNITTALAATFCIFNSEYNRREFCDGIEQFVRKFPDYPPQGVGERIFAKSTVLAPPFDSHTFDGETMRSDRPRIVWPHRWEHDKNPDDMVAAFIELNKQNLDFEVALCGQSFKETMKLAHTLEDILGDKLVYNRTPADAQEYARILRSSDIALSTAFNEFFGLAMVEAAYCGCFVVAPNRLAYPEIYPQNCLYDSTEDLVLLLQSLILERPQPELFRALAKQYAFDQLAPKYQHIFQSVIDAGLTRSV